jgi:hypothetical protein
MHATPPAARRISARKGVQDHLEGGDANDPRQDPPDPGIALRHGKTSAQHGPGHAAHGENEPHGNVHRRSRSRNQVGFRVGVGTGGSIRIEARIGAGISIRVEIRGTSA